MSDYRGGRHKKRRYHDDDERDYRQQRPRHDDPFIRLRKDVLSVAESPLIKVEDTVRNIAKSFVQHYSNENLRTSFVNLLGSLVVEQPFKIPFVAAIVLVANAKNEEIGKYVTEEFRSQMQTYLDACQWLPFKLMLRAFACMTSMFADDGLTILLDHVLDLAKEISSTNTGRGLPEELCKIVLITLPYLKSSAPGVISDESINDIVEKVSAISMSPPFEDQLWAYTGNGAPYGESDNVITLLLRQVQQENESGWDEGVLPRPWEVFRADLDAATKHPFPSVSLPTQTPNDIIYPEIYFSVFATQEHQTVPPNTNIAYSILRDSVADTINLLEFNRMSVARFLVDIDCYFAPDAFVKRATPFDKIKDIEPGRSTWKPEDIAVDAVFSLIFQLPQPQHKLVYYHSVLTEICKLAPQAVAPSLGRSIRFLYRHLESMDTELRYRFIDWFAHHLSNFGFTWKWVEWSGDLALSSFHPKKSFIAEALEKEIRLSFTSRVKGTLPEPYSIMMPVEIENELPEFKYDVSFLEEGKEMITLLKKRAGDEEIETHLSTTTEKATKEGFSDPASVGRQIYVTSICHIGAKSLSHVLSCIERCKEKLGAIGRESPLAQREIVKTVMNYWKEQPGVGANVVDKLLNYSILTPLSIIEWVLLDAGRTVLPRGYAWEMVNTTTRKVIARTKNLAAARDGLDQDDEQMKVLTDGYDVAQKEQDAILKCIDDSLTEYSHKDVSNGAIDFENEESVLTWWASMWLRALRRKFEVERMNEAAIAPPVAISGGPATDANMEDAE